METVNIDHIYRDGRHYDCLFGEPNVQFWLDMARDVDGPILELGCGTGKITIPLAEGGFQITGLDSSPAMLDRARNKTNEHPSTINWVQADMTSFSLHQRFGMIILPSNNICHLLTLDDVENCFQCIKKHLTPDGLFVIDVFVPSLKLNMQDPSQEVIMAEYDDPDGRGKCRVMARSHYESDTQIRRNSTRQIIPGQPDIIGSLDMRLFYPQELDGLLKFNGFRIRDKYGDYQLCDFRDGSQKQLIVALTA